MDNTDEFNWLLGVVKEEVFRISSSSLNVFYSESLWQKATEHKAAAILAAWLMQRNQLAPEIKDKLQSYWQKAALREVVYQRESQEIILGLKQEDVVAYPLKGMLLAPYYPKRGFRAFRDMDLWVTKEQLDRAYVYCLARGYAEIFPKGPLKKGEAPKVSSLHAARLGEDAINFVKEDFHLELHTVLLPPLLGSYPVSRPTAEDMLVHLCMHATRHHFPCGLRHAIDIALWIQTQKIDLEKVQTKLREQGVFHLVWPAWQLAHRYFPEVVESPKSVKNYLCERYTEKIARDFPNMPKVSLDFSGSPLIFVMMKDNWRQSFMASLSGFKGQALYQTGEPGAWSLWVWKFKRPFALVYRHAGLIFKWLRWMA